MPAATPTFRLFVSSTFEDLVAERNALQTKVFTELAAFCREEDARFHAVDLRWGVRDEAGLDQRTMEICFAEIDRCRRTGLDPNFMILLGDRYGWRPLPYRIDAAEFEAVRDAIADDTDRALVDAWYDLDRNAVPPERLLRPRSGELTDRAMWTPVEDRIRRTLRDGARAASLPDEQRIKYEASATHQEVLRRLHGTTDDDRKSVFAFFRKAAQHEDPNVAALKAFLRATLPAENVFEFADPETLCRNVMDALWRAMTTSARRIGPRDEGDAHEAFARERAASFVGREGILRAIGDSIRGDDRRPLVVFGPSGSGKSSILSRASEGLDAVRRFIGATPEATSGVAILRGLCREIDARFAQPDAELPATFDQLTVAFARRLQLATEERPLVVFLDALDQLGALDPASSLNWLPSVLPPHCRMVLSVTDVPPALRRAKLVEVEPFPVRDADKALGTWLGAARRTLQSEQRASLLASFEKSGLPLYLELASEEAKLWRSFDPPERCVLGADLPEIIDQLCARLSRKSEHGEVLVSHALGYLTAARYGLTEDEMIDVLTGDAEVWSDVVRGRNDPPERRLPVIVWSRLHLDLAPYLMERAVPGGTTISFYHRRLAERVTMRYLSGEDARRRYRLITDYFAARAPSRRTLSELPYQLANAGDWDALDRLLGDLPFPETKARAGEIRDLIEDYVRASALWSAQFDVDPPWIEFERFVTGEAHVIERFIEALPQIFFQQAFNQAKCGRIHDACRDREPDAYWIERVNRPEQPRVSACVLAFADHPMRVYAVAFSPDGAALATTSGDAIEIRDPKSGVRLRTLEGHEAAVLDLLWIESDVLLSASWDGTVRVWNPGSGDGVHALRGHSGPVTSVRGVAADRCVTAGFDGTVRVWDFGTGECVSVVEAHEGAVVAAFALDAQTIVSGGEDGTIRIGSRILRKGAPLTCLVPLRDGRIAAGDRGGRIEIWDRDGATPGVVLAGHRGAIAGVVQDGEGRFWSWSFDYTVRMWSRDGDEELELIDHDSAVTHGVLLGGWLITGSQDATLRVWDVGTGECKAVLRDHRSWITALAAQGNRIASGSRDRAVRVWNAAAAASAPADDLSAIVPDIVQAQSVAMAVVTARTRGLSLTLGPNHVQVWDLERGECTKIVDEEGSAEAKELYAARRARKSGPWTYRGGADVSEWGLELTGGALGERSDGPADGIACTWARARGDGLWESQVPALAFYPLNARPLAAVFETDRTLAFDALTREVHILRLHKPRRRP